MPLRALIGGRLCKCGVVEGGNVDRCAEGRHHRVVPLEQQWLCDEALEPARGCGKDCKQDTPSGERRIADIGTFLDNEVLEEELEKMYAEPVARKGGDGHEGMEGLDYSKTDVWNGMSEEGE